jgi:hypothetical protein
MRELSHRGDLDGALAAATRLAYEGVDPVVTPSYSDQLDEILANILKEGSQRGGCPEIIRELGGRYGILIERASNLAPFTRVGLCFEEMELPWLAATVYRSMARRFGAIRAQTIALPLARASLAIGEVTLSRRVATAALEDPDEDVMAWKAIVAEADFVDGRIDQAVEGLRAVLDSPKIRLERGKLIRLLALTLEKRGQIEDAQYIAERVPRWLEQDQAEPISRANMIEAAMLAAHAHRRAGESEGAMDLYRVVERYSTSDALDSSARFWLGLAGEMDSSGESPWAGDPRSSLVAPWGRLARFEKRYRPIRESYSDVIR